MLKSEQHAQEGSLTLKGQAKVHFSCLDQISSITTATSASVCLGGYVQNRPPGFTGRLLSMDAHIPTWFREWSNILYTLIQLDFGFFSAPLAVEISSVFAVGSSEILCWKRLRGGRLPSKGKTLESKFQKAYRENVEWLLQTGLHKSLTPKLKGRMGVNEMIWCWCFALFFFMCVCVRARTRSSWGAAAKNDIVK